MKPVSARSCDELTDSDMTRVKRVSAEGAADVLSGASCAFGVFDGVHRGHQFLIECARLDAMERNAPSAVLTFSVDPDELFAPDRLIKLMSNDERIAALMATGVDIVAVLPFDRAFAALSPIGFLDSAFGDSPPASMHVGEGFRFGSRGSGDARLLSEWGAPRGMEVIAHELLDMDGIAVSSTRIRSLLMNGHLSEAERLLGHLLDGAACMKD